MKLSGLEVTGHLFAVLWWFAHGGDRWYARNNRSSPVASGKVWVRLPLGRSGCVGASDLRVLARSSFQSARPVQGYVASSMQPGLD